MDPDEIEKLDLSDPYVVVNIFVAHEFQGAPNLRFHFARFTPASREKKHVNELYHMYSKSPCGCFDCDDFGRIMDIEDEEMFIVSKYKILSIDITDDHGTAIIDYDRVASASGDGIQRRIFIDRKEHDLVKLNLKRYGQRWQIIDPPLWRISLDVIPTETRPQAKNNEPISSERLPDPVSQEYREFDDVRILNYLKATRSDQYSSPGASHTQCGGKSSVSPPAPISPDAAHNRSDPRKVVQAFVDLEFNGNDGLRRHVAALSGNIRELLETRDARDDELIVVSRYNIQNVRTEGDQGIAEVDYDRLASTKRIGNLRRMFPDEKEHDQITLKLQQSNGAWFIVDPPPWRISLVTLADIYQKEFLAMGGSPTSPDPESCEFQLMNDHDLIDYYIKKMDSNTSQEEWMQESHALEFERRQTEKNRIEWKKTSREIRTANLQEASPNGSRNWRDPVTGMEFVWIPEGTFGMGCGSWVEECYDDERPLHLVTLKGFWLGKYEVTQAQWQGMMGSNPNADKHNDGRTRENHPVGFLSWTDAITFIQKLNARSDGKFRLPTEAEWEYACRSGGREERYAGGGELAASAWYHDNSEVTTHPVGTKRSNNLGLHDLSGNVQEWVQDRYDMGAYDHHSRFNPLATQGEEAVIRGGNYYSGNTLSLRCTYRAAHDPTGEGLSVNGVRLARNP
ncbi:MAG: formylglycine-generating enzyme family protein [Magnetococcales bacterium]|nr:formylglycine-generating enzyme family protein [Magnetococcales bacterium]